MSARGRTLMAKGSRLYADDGEEIAVATKASPKYRHLADGTAAEIARRWNTHARLLMVYEAARSVSMARFNSSGREGLEVALVALKDAINSTPFEATNGGDA